MGWLHDYICVSYEHHVKDPEPVVLAARLWVGNEIFARDVDWPQPFKYLDLSDRKLDVDAELLASGATRVTFRAHKPVKGLVLEESVGVRLSDNALDIVPGDEQSIVVEGLKGRALKYRYLGLEREGEVPSPL